MIDPEILRSLSDHVQAIAVRQEHFAGEVPTRENWNAVECLRDAERRLFSASAWLERQGVKHGA